jgi:hypothetical protein
MTTPPPWYVLTGGPCAGKTTLLAELEKRGYKTVPEAARTYIDQERAKGRTLEEIRSDEGAFQHALIPMKVSAEQNASKDDVTFFDRGMHDSLVYFSYAGVSHHPELDEPIPPQGAEFDEFDDEFAPPQYGGPGDGDSAPPQDAGLTREYEFDLNDDELDLQRDMYFQLQQGHQARQERQQVHQREEIRENVLRAALERQRRAQRFTLRRRAHW